MRKIVPYLPANTSIVEGATVRNLSKGVYAGTRNPLRGVWGPGTNMIPATTLALPATPLLPSPYCEQGPSQDYHDITRIEFVNLRNPLLFYNLWLNPAPIEITVADHATPTNKVTAITDVAIKDLYVPEDPATHTAHVDIRTPVYQNSSSTEKDVHVTIQRKTTSGQYDEIVYDGDLADFDSGARTFGGYRPAPRLRYYYLARRESQRRVGHWRGQP